MRLEKYLKDHSTQTEFAKKLGVSQGLVYQWLQFLAFREGRVKLNRMQQNRVTTITAERAIQIETASNGLVTRQELRPDIFGKPARSVAVDPRPAP